MLNVNTSTSTTTTDIRIDPNLFASTTGEFRITLNDETYNDNIYYTPAGNFIIPGEKKVRFNNIIKRIKKNLIRLSTFERMPTRDLPLTVVPYGRYRGRRVDTLGITMLNYYIEHCRTDFSQDCLDHRNHRHFFKAIKALRREFMSLCGNNFSDMRNQIPEFKGRIKQIEKRFRYFYSDYCSKTDYHCHELSECYNILSEWFNIPEVRTRYEDFIEL